MDPAEHIRLGRALAPLRDEGILIVGSGMSYHNMRTLMTNMRGGANDCPPDSGSQCFDDWLEEVLTREAPEAPLPRWPPGTRRLPPATPIHGRNTYCRFT